MEITEEMFEAWYRWVCGGDRNPFDESGGDAIEKGKAFVYWSSWDNAADRDRASLSIFDFERMEEDPNADSIHWAAMIAAEEWERRAREALEDGRELPDYWD